MQARRSEEIESLTGLRGVAALMVVLYHANESFIKAAGTGAMMFHGRLFVDLFYVLSGFVMCHVYVTSKEISWPKFFVARFARIWPLHIATALFAALGLFALGGPSSPELNFGQFIRELTLTQAMPFIWRDTIWNSPSWSISVEFWCYFLVFPFAYIGAKRLSTTTIVVMGFSIFLVALLMLSLLPLNPARGGGAFIRAASGFLAGWSVWKLCGSEVQARTKSVSAPILILCFFGLTQFYSRDISDPWYALLIAPAIVISVVKYDSIARRWLESRPVVFLGTISYSIYLIHPLLLKSVQIAFSKLGLIHFGFATFASCLLILLIPVSHLSYRLFEMPTRALIRDLISRPAPKLPPAEAQ
jgi:Predicted acyltransferases